MFSDFNDYRPAFSWRCDSRHSGASVWLTTDGLRVARQPGGWSRLRGEAIYHRAEAGIRALAEGVRWVDDQVVSWGWVSPWKQSGYQWVQRLASTVLIGAQLLSYQAFALPQGWNVVAGDVRFQSGNKELEVNARSNRSIVEYQSFNVAADEVVRFQLPSDTARILNRVVGNGRSTIAGTVLSNGQLVLVNPGGISMLSGSQISATHFTASTLDVDNNTFLNSDTLVFQRKPGQAPASIVSEGTIDISPGGQVNLVAGAIQQTGIIRAPQGQINLAVGDTVQVTLDPYIQADVEVDKPLQEAVENYNAAIYQTGAMVANRITQQAKLRQSVYETAINSSGRIEAQSVAFEDGAIVFRAEDALPDSQVLPTSHSTLVMNGDYEVTGGGGRVEVQGGRIEMNGVIRAEGMDEIDGGEVSLRGVGDVNFGEDSLISVRGRGADSDAGSIIVWSDETTRFATGAVMDAQGGEISGDGGFIELSALDTVWLGGSMLGSATNGVDGTLLIDPTVIRIQAGGFGGSSTIDSTLPNNSGAESIFSAASFGGFSNVTLEATQDIFVETAWNLPNITSGNRLTLRAGNDIRIQDTITTGGGNINLIADAALPASGVTVDGVGGITITGAGSLDTNGGDVSLIGATVDLDGTIDAGLGTVSVLPSTAGPEITLGGAAANNDVAGVRLDLADVELNRIAAGTLSIGSYTQNNDVRLLGDIDLSRTQGTLGGYDLDIQTAGNFDGTGHTIDLGSNRNSVLLDGNNDYLAIEDLFYNTANSIDEFTVAFWVRSSGTGNSGIFDFDRSESFQVGVNFHGDGAGAGRISFDTSGSGIGIHDMLSNARIDDGQWHHVIVRYDNATSLDKAIFLNGNLDNAQDAYAGGASLGTPITRYGFIGDGSEASGFDGGRNSTYFTGNLDDLRFYDRALSDAEISTLYSQASSSEVSGPEANLVLGFNFNSETGGIVADQTGNSYNAHLRNGAVLVGGNDLDIQTQGNIQTGTILNQGLEASLQAENNLTVTGNIVGDITLIADADGNNSGNLIVNSTVTTGNQNLTLQGAQIDINQTINVGTGDLTLLPTVNKLVQLGATTDNNDSGSVFDISTPELERIIASDLLVGNSNTMGDIELAGNLNLGGRPGTDGGSFDLTLETCGSFDANGHQIHLGRDSLYLDGTDDYLAIENLFYSGAGSLDEVTVAMWLRVDNTANQAGILDFDRSEWYSFGSNFIGSEGLGGISWDTTDGTSTVHDMGSTVAIDDGTWQFVVATFDSSQVLDKSIYINGALDNAQDGHATGVGLGTANNRYGFVGDGSEAPGFDGLRNDRYYRGQLDGIQIYDRALSATEVSELYNNGIGRVAEGTEAGLDLAYNLNELTGSTAPDVTGNGNNGQFRNGPQWVGAKNLTIKAGDTATLANIIGDGSDVTVTANSKGVGGTIVQTGTIDVADQGTLSLTVLPDPVTRAVRPLTSADVVSTGLAIAPITKEFYSHWRNMPEPGDNQAHRLTPLPLDIQEVPQLRGMDGEVPVADGQSNLAWDWPTGWRAWSAGRMASGHESQGDAGNRPVLYRLNPGADSLSVLDGQSGDTLAIIPVGDEPQKMEVSPTGDWAVVLNGGDESLSLVDLKNRQQVKTVALEGTPRDMAWDYGNNRVYVSLFDKDTVAVVNLAEGAVLSRIAVGQKPLGLALHPDGQELWVTHFGDGTLGIVSTVLNELVQAWGVGQGPKNIVMSPLGYFAYVGDFLNPQVLTVDTRSRVVVNRQNVGAFPYGLGVSTDGQELWVATQGGERLEGIQTSTLQGSDAKANTHGPGLTTGGITNRQSTHRVWAIQPRHSGTLVAEQEGMQPAVDTEHQPHGVQPVSGSPVHIRGMRDTVEPSSKDASKNRESAPWWKRVLQFFRRR